MPAPDEFELIRRYFTPSFLPAHVSLGVGDDCALLQIPAGCELAISVDTQVADVHFHRDAPPAGIASRALCCAASDLAAMGASPLGFTLALTLPSADEKWLREFSRGLLQAAEQLQCPLIGGDTTRGSLTISIQVHGSVPSGRALKRSGAKAGDDIWVSGTLGDGAAALALLENTVQFDDHSTAYLQQRFYQPDIDFALAVQLRDIANSCIDVSDGLLADLEHICKASAVGAILHQAQLPLAKWQSDVAVEQALQWALTGGDDYRLCFTASASQREVLQTLPGVFRIGEITEATGITVLDAQGVSCVVDNYSYQHF